MKKDLDDEAQARFRRRIRERIGYIHPFEIHVMTKEQLNKWYLRL